MRSSLTLKISSVLVLALMAGCSSTKMTQRESHLRANEKLGRPSRIVVHNFAATAEDMSPRTVGEVESLPPSAAHSAEEVAAGRKLGELVADELVTRIKEMGLPAEKPRGDLKPGDVVITGYFESVEEGSAAKRIVLGFGAGAAELVTVVEGYQMTDQGLRKLGRGQIDSNGGKTPGVLLPVAVTAATANPIGLVVGGAAKVTGEVTGRTKLEGAAKRTAKEIAAQLEVAFRKQGWI